MNERIKLLAEQAWVDNDQLDACGYTDLDKFAQLIVRECANIVANNQAEDMGWDISEIIKEHFGVKE